MISQSYSIRMSTQSTNSSPLLFLDQTSLTIFRLLEVFKKPKLFLLVSTGFYHQLREAAMADNGITLPVPIIRAHSHGHIIQLLRPGLVIDLAGSGTTGRRTRRGREDDPMCRTKSREILLRHRLKQR